MFKHSMDKTKQMEVELLCSKNSEKIRSRIFKQKLRNYRIIIKCISDKFLDRKKMKIEYILNIKF